MSQPDRQNPVPENVILQEFPRPMRRSSILKELGEPIISDSESLVIEKERLAGRTAFVTGASSGLGRATAELFGGYGMNIAIVARDGERARLTKQRVELNGGVGHVILGDLRDPEIARKAVEEAAERFGRIDVGVLNAGIIQDAEILDMTASQWYDVAHGNGDMAFFPAQALARQMVSQENEQDPNLVFVSSVSMVGNPGQPNYSYAKAGIEALAKAFSRSTALKAISVGILTPGGIDTEMIQNLNPDQQRMFNLMMRGMMPAKKAFSAEEMAKGVAYLATQPKSSDSGYRLVLA